MKAADALIIGGGLAGSALAIQLARAGRDVILLEKEARAHHKVCGEFLSGEALHYLEALGVDPAKLGAVPIDNVRLAARRMIGKTALPFRAQSLSRYRLDEELLERAKLAGVRLRRGEQVEKLAQADGVWIARTNGEEHRGSQAFLATGKHDLRSWRRPAGRQPDLIGFKMHWHLSRRETDRLSGAVELTLFPGGYAGLQMVEGGVANLCLLVRRTQLKQVGTQWPKLLAHILRYSEHLSEQLGDAEAVWPSPLAISPIPYGYVRRHGEGPWRLGDQAGVIPSFAGSGMSIALHSAHLAAATYLEGSQDVNAFQRRLAVEVQRQIVLGTSLSQALVSQRWMPVVKNASRWFPKLISIAASATRISRAALR